MYSTRSKNALSTALSGLNAKGPTVDIQHFATAGSGLARFVARLVHSNDSRENPKMVMDAIRDKFDGKLMAVAGSVNIAEDGPVTSTITGILAVRRDVIAMAADETPEGFKAVACNMFLDDENHIWSLNKTESGSMFIRSNGIEDDAALLGLLSAQASAAPNSRASAQLAALASAVRDRVAAGDFVTFVDNNNELTCGFVVAAGADDASQLMVLQPGAAEEEIINANAVTDIVDMPEGTFPELSADEQIDLQVAVARSNVTAEHLISYYKRIFGMHKEFFAQLTSRIKSHAFA